MAKTVLGLVETVTITDRKGYSRTLKAKVDTGATRSSLDAGLVKEMDFGPVLKRKLVKSAHGATLRTVKAGKITLGSRQFKTEFTIADRAHLRYKILIGVNVLQHGFLVDPSKK